MDEYIHSPSYPQIHMPLKEDQIKQLRDVFMMIDGNGDGTDLRKKMPFLTQGDGPLGD
jgi:Ca2+-binding EF-hand superfamily protein